MVVPLLALPDASAQYRRLEEAGICLRRGQVYEADQVTRWVADRWKGWVAEVAAAFNHLPVRLFIATLNGDIIGFAAFDVAYLGLFGPTAVDPEHQGKGVGAALLLRSLEAMREAGYLYAIIGDVGPAGFDSRVAGAYSLPAEWPSFTDPDVS